ncbi:MAG TPA: hypothetical protein VG649_11030 [Candidatus Angelobacter sp.]|nr:hypothetical protein [Candidatus Angelobacter sp.]
MKKISLSRDDTSPSLVALLAEPARLLRGIVRVEPAAHPCSPGPAVLLSKSLFREVLR